MSGFRSVLVLMLACCAGVACATKSDIDRLSGELASLRVRQDSVLAVMSALRNTLVERLRETESSVVTSRGDVQRQLNDMERQLVQIQELLGQSQIALQEMRNRVANRPQPQDFAAPDTAGAAERGAPPDRVGPTDPGGSEEGSAAVYAAAIEQFRRGAYNTARAGFEEFLIAYPADALAPDAQYYLAETYREEGQTERALREYNRVVELYPNSRSAPTALYKAGLLQVELGNKDFACEYFNRVLAGFPRSDEARLARDQAGRLNCS